MPDPSETQVYPDCAHRAFCVIESDRLWEEQKKINQARRELDTRWGAWKDETQAKLAELSVEIVKSRDLSAKFQKAIEHVQEQMKKDSDANAAVLRELAEDIRASRQASEANHEAVMSVLSNHMVVVSANQATAGRAVDQANLAAQSAHDAQEEAGKFRKDLSTLTRTTIIFAGLALSLGGTTLFYLIKEFGWPLIESLLHR